MASKVRKEAASALGFKNMAELARVADVYDGDICKIYKGIIRLSDKNAHKLVKAVMQRRGWTYLEAASQLVEVLNYLRNHYAYSQNKSVKQIEDTDVRRWHQDYLKELSKAIIDFDDPLNIVTLSSSTEEILDCLLKFLRSWETKHDFGLFDKVEQKFQQNKSLIVIPGIRRGMEEGFYSQIKDIYTEIRHIAHLCREFELVRNMSDWLIERSKHYQDIQTEVKAKVTLAWTHTSDRSQSSLFTAQQLVKDMWNVVNSTNFLNNVCCEDMDVIAILCELRLRLAIRLEEQQLRPLEVSKFNQLKSESEEVLKRSVSFQSLSSRLKTRYELPLDYQEGVYLYRLGQYEEAREKFEYIAKKAELIGWIRVEQAAYSWLATLWVRTGQREEVVKMLEKINVIYLPKRQQIREQILALISDNQC
jgi:tetratricopeptide (TPR) repeat protein